MSALIAHIKAMRALANAYGALSVEVGPGTAEGRLWSGHGAAYLLAADALEEQARAECSGDERPPAHAPRKRG